MQLKRETRPGEEALNTPSNHEGLFESIITLVTSKR